MSRGAKSVVGGRYETAGARASLWCPHGYLRGKSGKNREVKIVASAPPSKCAWRHSGCAHIGKGLLADKCNSAKRKYEMGAGRAQARVLGRSVGAQGRMPHGSYYGGYDAGYP